MNANAQTVPAWDRSPWLEALLAISRHYRLDVSEERVKVGQDWLANRSINERLTSMARDMGMSLHPVTLSEGVLDPWRLPALAEFSEGQIGVIESVDANGGAGVRLSGEGGGLRVVAASELRERIVRLFRLSPNVSAPDARVDDYIKPYEANWFWKLVMTDWRRYGDVMAASLVANLLAMAIMTFSMQVYDRVIPAQSEPTLWVLFAGVVVAVAFEFCMRLARAHVSDHIGKRADLRISDRVFGHALRLRNDVRSRSTGSFISQLRELEQVRELITSTTLGALADLPFFFLFLAVLWYIGGAMALVPLIVVPLLIIPGWLAQGPLAKWSKEGMRDSALRNAILVEAVQGIEDIKMLRAEARFQNQWNHLNETAAAVGKKQRFLTAALTTWAQEMQSLVYALVILVGCFLVMKGDMTTGALVGMSMLSSRMIAPLSQLSGIMARWQQAKVARQGLDELMKRPVDQPDHNKMLHRPALHGDYKLEQVRFRYQEKDTSAALDIPNMQIRAGERVAILGRNGAGKSTLLQMLAGMQLPQEGHVQLDGVRLDMLDPYDVRRDVGYLGQQAQLFHGSLRDNLTMGNAQAGDEQIIHALRLSGAWAMLQSLPRGLDHPVLEGGRGLSGGQRQLILLARTLIRDPRIVLLDEPSASLDEISEQQLIEAMSTWLQGRTLVVATHRPAILKWVDRIIVVEGGRIAIDDHKDVVINKLKRPQNNLAVSRAA